jgi:hypothetical protein
MKINEENLLITDGKETQQNNLTNGSLINIPIQMGSLFFCLPMEETGLMKTTPILKYITIKILVMVGVAFTT